MVRGYRFAQMGPDFASQCQDLLKARLDIGLAVSGGVLARARRWRWNFRHAASPATQASQQPFANVRTRPM